VLKKILQLHPAKESDASEAVLHVSLLYQDPLTQRWAEELWSHVGQLTGNGGISRKAWRFEELARARVLRQAVRVAAKADVLLIALRETEAVPPVLRAWAEGWLPQRAGRPGALVALIGVGFQPGGRRGSAHEFLKRVAAKAGLDYLPRERKIPDQGRARRNQARVPANAWLALAI